MSRRSSTAHDAADPTDDPAASVDNRSRAILRRLELDITRRLDGLLQGDYRGLIPGLGSEPGEARVYTPGDDVRRMDWNVTARTGQAHIRNTIADRELETWALVDLSPSLDWGTSTRTKADLAIAAVAAIGILTERAGNRIGAIVSDGDQLHEIRTGGGRRHTMALLDRLSNIEPRKGGSDGLNPGLRRMAGPGRRGGLAVVVSDLLGPDFSDGLKAVCLRHETLVMEIVDQRELELPDVGTVEFVDAESGKVVEINTGKRSVRERYAEAGRERLAAHAAAVRGAGADHLVLRTDQDWVVELAKFVDRRRRGGRRMIAQVAR